MSFQAMTWAVEQDLPVQQKMVLLMLANHTNSHTGKCDPSLKLLSKECGMSHDSVSKATKILESFGLLQVLRKNYKGVKLHNEYKLLMPGIDADSVEYTLPAFEVHADSVQGVHADSVIRVNQLCKPEPCKPISTRGSRLPDSCPDLADLAFCKEERPDLDPVKIAAEFRDYWISIPGQKGCKLDWSATWRNWIRRTETKVSAKPHQRFDDWHKSEDGICRKAKELGVSGARPGETWANFKDRVWTAVNRQTNSG